MCIGATPHQVLEIKKEMKNEDDAGADAEFAAEIAAVTEDDDKMEDFGLGTLGH